MSRTALVSTVIITFGLCGVCHSEVLRKDIAVGEWSKPVTDSRGYALRGRLIVAEKRVSDERRETPVYIELQDVSEAVGGSMRIFCDLGRTDFREDSKSGLRCELSDAKGNLIRPTGYPFSGGIPRSEWVHLPSDSSIRLRTSPFGIHRPGALAISPLLNSLWVIADEDPQEYFLSGTFTVDPEEGRRSVEDPHIWRGTLILPPVRIAARGR